MINNWILDIKKELDLYNNGEVYSFAYSVTTTPEDYKHCVYVNTVCADDLDFDNFIDEDLYGHIIDLRVNDNCSESFNITLSVKISSNGNIRSWHKNFLYNPVVLSDYTYDKERFNKMINDNVSYQLLRVNPKLTGNVKVVVTEDSKLYLDTFKVSLALGQYKYRHIPVNPKTFYGKSVMTAFHKMSSDDFYKIEDNCFNLFTTVNDYKLQYYDIYNSGVRTNADHLYKENFALLAPLCVKQVIPDFFLIFKVKTDIYNKKKNMSESDKIKYFFSNGELVKSFDMRDGTNLGTYIRNTKNAAMEYPGDIFVAYDNTNYNKFMGISIDRGVVTSAYESIYKEDKISNQVAYNEYFTTGFQRNRLISKDIINFEFMFNDTEEKLFSINTYFGIYVKLNGEKNNFSCIGYDGTYKFDLDSLHNFNSGTNLNDPEYAELIYGLSTPKEFIRLKESIYDSSVMENYKLRPYKSVITGNYYNIAEDSDYEFMTVTLKNKVKVGEHFRIIDLKHSTIYDIIASNNKHYLDNHNISDVSFNYIWHKKVRFTIKNVCAYFEEENQAQTLFFAFKKLNSDIEITWKDNTIVFKSYNKNLIFEKISAFSDFTNSNLEKLEKYTGDDESIILFDAFYPEKTILPVINPDLADNDYFYLYPFYAEATGARIVYLCDFMKVSKNSLQHAVKSEEIQKISKDTVLYRKEDKSVEIYKGFNIKYTTNKDGDMISKNKEVYYLLSPLLDNIYIINVENPEIYNSTLSLYSSYPINSGICSIIPLKDFNFDILDSNTNINYFTGERIPIGDNGEFTKNSVFEDGGISRVQEEYAVDYFDKNRKYDKPLYTDITIQYNALSSNSDKNAYYKNLLKENHIYSDISLISPYICKWESNGTDARGKNMRLMYSFNASLLKDTFSYYVPYSKKLRQYRFNDNGDGKYDENLGYLQTRTGNTFEKYINKSFDGMVLSDDIKYGISIRDAILSGRISIDDIVYSEISNVNKFSRVYKSGDNTLEFISGGIKFKIHSFNDDILNFNTYGTYQAIFISVPGHNSAHSKQMELIIDEVNEQFVFIYYQNINDIEIGADPKPELNYEIPYQYSLQKSKCIDVNNLPCLETPADTNKDLRCNSIGYYILENEHAYDSKEYTKRDNVMLISKIDSDIDFTYGTHESYATTELPSILYGNNVEHATNQLINNNADLYHDAVKSYIITDSEEYDTRKIKNISDLDIDVKSCAVYVRKYDGAKDYTGVDNLLKIETISPYLNAKTEYIKINENDKPVDSSIKTYGFVQTTYGKPQMTDMFSFAYRDKELNNIFGYIFDGMNIRINGIKQVQRWINKYTNSINYCIPTNGEYPRLSLDYINGISLLDNCWSDIYRNYNVITDNDTVIEQFDKVLGYETGYEVNRFLHSRGVNLNGVEGNTVEINLWKNTKVSEREKVIKLDVTESLIYNILFTKGYSESWKYLNLRSNTYKIKYIKNTILPLLNIDNNCVFTLYKFENTKKLLFRDLNASDDIVKVDNVKHELKYENGKYYMYIYPTDLHTYYAKMYIKL